MLEDRKIRVLATTVMINDLVKEVGKEHVFSLPLIDKELDPHSYQLVKGDDEKLSSADLIFYNGVGLEHGASLAYQLNHLSNAHSVGDAIKQKKPEKIIQISGMDDPHIWMDVSLWIEAIDLILDILVQFKPEYAEDFKMNAKALKNQMNDLHQLILEKMGSIPSKKRYLVTSHNSFNYFTKTYLGNKHEWEERFAAPEGLAPEGQLNPLDLQKIIQYLHDHEIHIVFSESNISPDSIRKIAASSEELGWKVKIPQESLYSDAMKEYKEQEISYLKTMEYNAETIQRYLND